MNHLLMVGGRSVPSDTLDSVIGDRLMRGPKLDVEGAEHRFLKGAIRALSQGRIEIAQLDGNQTAIENFGEGSGARRGTARRARLQPLPTERGRHPGSHRGRGDRCLRGTT